MKHLFTTLLAYVCCLSMAGQAVVLYETDFNGGIPSGFTMYDMDENPVKASCYQNVDYTNSWFVGEFYASTFTYDKEALKQTHGVAMSPSRCTYKFASENWLITPAITISTDSVYLKWDAMSLHPDFPESYRVMISTVGAEDVDSFEELAVFEDEADFWTTRFLSLEAYRGKTVYLAFVCVSNNKFMLAIDNLYVGTLDVAMGGTDTSRRFCGDVGNAPVQGVVRNMGKEITLTGISCQVGTISEELKCDAHLLPGQEVEYAFSVPVKVGQRTHYKLTASLSDGSQVSVLEDSVICSYYPRTLLVEEATFTHCNNCPEGNVYLKPIRHRFAKEELITVACHMNDKFHCAPYVMGLQRWLLAAPTFAFNRGGKDYTQIQMYGDKYATFKSALCLETPALVEATVERNADNPALLDIKAEVHFALSYANTTDRYRIGYAILEHGIPATDSTIQHNSATQPSSMEYLYMPSRIPAELMTYNDVPREGMSAFDGVAGSLPTSIKAGDVIDYNHQLEIPVSKVVDQNNLSLVVYVIDTYLGKCFNATEVAVPTYVSGIEQITASGETVTPIRISLAEGGQCTLMFTDTRTPYQLEVVSLDGKVMLHMEGIPDASGTTLLDLPEMAGADFSLIRVMQAGRCAVRKGLLKR